MRGCFVTGTDTGVGKTVVAAAIVAALRAKGIDAIGLKPVLTGTDERPNVTWPPDDELLASVSELKATEVNFVSYGPPVSPHLAARLADRPLEPEALAAAIAQAGQTHEAIVVEGVGGLLVPLSDTSVVADVAAATALPLVIVARPGLGTINHTLLTIEVARTRGLEVSLVVLNRWPAQPGEIERSNLETIKRLGTVEVATVPELPGPHRDALRSAGQALAVERWM